MSRRLTLAQIRGMVLVLLDDEWRTPSELHRHLSRNGGEWYKTALVLERLAADGLAELRGRGSRVRRFRRAA